MHFERLADVEKGQQKSHNFALVRDHLDHFGAGDLEHLGGGDGPVLWRDWGVFPVLGKGVIIGINHPRHGLAHLVPRGKMFDLEAAPLLYLVGQPTHSFRQFKFAYI